MYVYKQPVIQFTKCSELISIGNDWHGSVWGAGFPHTFTPDQLATIEEEIRAYRTEQGIEREIRPAFIHAVAEIQEEQRPRSSGERQSHIKLERDRLAPIAETVAQRLPPGWGLSSGYQPYDPVIRYLGRRPKSYTHLIRLLNVNAVGNAALLLRFLHDEVDLEDLPQAVQELAVIVCVAERGRGYAIEPLCVLAERIVSSKGGINWSSLKEYFPAAMTSKEDERDYMPPDWGKGPGPSGGGGGWGGDFGAAQTVFG